MAHCIMGMNLFEPIYLVSLDGYLMHGATVATKEWLMMKHLVNVALVSKSTVYDQRNFLNRI